MTGPEAATAALPRLVGPRLRDRMAGHGYRLYAAKACAPGCRC